MGSSSKGSHLGAVWKKCDFQIHSPRDHGWHGGSPLPGGDSGSEAKRAAWADEFVAACLEKGLAAIAITDHHDHVFVDYVQDALEKLDPPSRESIWVFPGMEITCNDSCQCIVLFDVATDRSTMDRLFGGSILRNVEMPDRSAAKTFQTEVCGSDLKGIIESIAGDPVLRAKTIILPHGGNDNAHKTIFRRGFHTRFAQLSFEGVYAAGKIGDMDASTLDKIYGKISEWGPRRRGLLLTSDSRGASFDSLGRSDCWIRLGEPTTEAIRQALLADEARIVYELPHTPSQRIMALRVSSSLCGHSFVISFNDGLTCLIGGRGSGKSALLEYLRFGLGRSARDTGEGPVRERERDLIEETLLGDDEIEVTLLRDGLVERWIRGPRDFDGIRIQLSGAEEKITPAEARRRFRGRAYYQKQLSTLVVDPAEASEQITSIAAAEFVDERRAVDAESDAAKRAITVAISRYEEFCANKTRLKDVTAGIDDTKRRIKATEELLEQAGLGEADRLILNQASVHDRAEAYIASVTESCNADEEKIVGFKGEVLAISLMSFPDIEPFDEIRELSQKVEAVRGRISQLLDSALDEIRRLQGDVGVYRRRFDERASRFKVELEAATQRQAAHRSLVDDLTRLNRELTDAEHVGRALEAQTAGLADAPANLRETRERLARCVERRRKVLERSASRIVSMSNGSLRAERVSEQTPREYTEALIDLMRGARVRNLEARVEERPGLDPEGWSRIGDLLLEVLARKAGREEVEPDDESRELVCEATLEDLNSNQQRQVFLSINAANVARILSATAVDSVRFEYQDRGRWIEFGKASPGQQASAILNLLLKQEAGTLIIDQPEDDLDNRKIMDIAKLIQKTKRTRQLIFATHNANIAVNGDADKIIALVPVADEAEGIMMAPRIAIEVDGAIETAGIKEAVTHTMEGGKEAFELRGRKYAFSR